MLINCNMSMPEPMISRVQACGLLNRPRAFFQALEKKKRFLAEIGEYTEILYVQKVGMVCYYPRSQIERLKAQMDRYQFAKLSNERFNIR